MSVRKLSELCPKSEVLLCLFKTLSSKPKSEVQSMSEVQNPSLKPKSEVCQMSKSETKIQSLNAQNSKSEVENLKSKVCLKSV